MTKIKDAVDLDLNFTKHPITGDVAKKTGIEAVIHNFAYEESLLYGILCVIAAVFAGWLASIIFWKI